MTFLKHKYLSIKASRESQIFILNRKQTVDLLIFHESFDFISFPIFLPCNKKLQEHWVIKLNIQTIK